MTRTCDKVFKLFYEDGNEAGCPRCPLICLTVSIVMMVTGFGLSMSSIKGVTAPELHTFGVMISGVGLLLCLIFLAIVSKTQFKHNCNLIPSFVTEVSEVSSKQYEVFTSEKNYERRKISPVQLLSTKKASEETDSTPEGSEYGCISSGSQPLLPPSGSQPLLPPSSSEPRSILKASKDPQCLPKNDLKVRLRIDPILIPSFEVIKETPEEIREIGVLRSPVPSPCKVWKAIDLNQI